MIEKIEIFTGEIFTGLDGIKKGKSTNDVEPLIDELIGNKKGAFFSDFDKTVIESDFGVQCFNKMLHDKDYWKWDPKQFSELLLPTIPTDGNVLSYDKLIRNIAESHNDKDIESNAKKLINLYENLIPLYTKIKQKKSPELQLQKEFAVKMQKFDEIAIILDRFFAKFFGNQIFSRLRFLAGQAHTTAKEISAKVINEGQVKINNYIFNIFKYLKKQGSEGKIITTNLLSFIREAVRLTILNEIFEEDDVFATQMCGIESGNRFIMNNMILGEPVLGLKKALLAKQESFQKNNPIIMAAGDSPFGDGPMLAESLKQGGIAIIPVSLENYDLEKIANEFKTKISNILNTKELPDEILQRMWYLKTNNFINSKN